MASVSQEGGGDTLDAIGLFGSLDIFDEGLCKRSLCEKCKRPIAVCWCSYLPCEPIQIQTTLYILQHPFEESRSLRTVPILQNCVPKENCHVIRGKRFAFSKYPQLMTVLESPNTLLLYPGDDAIDVSELPTDVAYNLVLLDGTWSQARGIFAQNNCLKSLKKVQVQPNKKSKYVIRTQPYDSALSTLEAAAAAIASLERREDVYEVFTHPLQALCDFQLQHGAVKHQSREFKIENGLWTKPLRRSVQRRLAEKRAQEQGKSST
ncbi:Dtw domain-containing protein 2 [Plakobranchus ocellatus]|uniref:tRNA-uridine aminocarboxypropyltransferase n=1 Tax=Plakobranchus ocellatus TaxID=259542 RepID=A0AAV4D1Q3_9GAST|nr:Dtw domain-containing protein 2 [Plakobranchus ocellatus]